MQNVLVAKDVPNKRFGLFFPNTMPDKVCRSLQNRRKKRKGEWKTTKGKEKEITFAGRGNDGNPAWSL